MQLYNMTLEESVNQFVTEKYDYFRQWTLDFPFVIRPKVFSELKEIQKIMEKLIRDFVLNYKEYAHLMPVEPRVAEILALTRDVPYRLGTYRTDFVLDDNNQFKLIEITCRFALNGIFETAIFEHFNSLFKEEYEIQQEQVNEYKKIFAHIEKYIEGVERVVVLTGSDLRNESKIYATIFERMGLPVELINYKELEPNMLALDRALVVSELAFEELKILKNDTLIHLIKAGVLNDLRTIFLIHDKRFFEVLNSRVLQNKNLTEAEKLLFKRYTIPSHTYRNDCVKWQDAAYNKDKWILKHRALGKSQDVFAGSLLTQAEWSELFERQDISDMVLQEWVKQKTFKNYYLKQPIEEYIVGTLLFFDEHFFGPGEFRTSSYPITNKVDHRKAAAITFKQKTPPQLLQYQF